MEATLGHRRCRENLIFVNRDGVHWYLCKTEHQTSVDVVSEESRRFAQNRASWPPPCGLLRLRGRLNKW